MVRIKIRKAIPRDFGKLYMIGLQTPELRVSSSEPFMDKDDFKLRITSKQNVFLVAEFNAKIVGFICASIKDSDRPLRHRYACLVYIVVLPRHRHQGIANELYSHCIWKLKSMGINYVYAWVNAESSAAQMFLKSKKFNVGSHYIWMDNRI